MKKIVVVLVLVVAVLLVLVRFKSKSDNARMFAQIRKEMVPDSLKKVTEDSLMMVKCKGIGSVAVFTIGKTRINDVRKYMDSYDNIYTIKYAEGVEQRVTVRYDLDKFNTLSDLRLQFWNGVLYSIETSRDYYITSAYVSKYGDGIKEEITLPRCFVTKHKWDNGRICAESYHTADRYGDNINKFEMYDKDINSKVVNLWAVKHDKEEKLRLSKI